MSLSFIETGTRVEVRSTQGTTPHITTVAAVLEEGRILLDIMRLGGDEKRLDVNFQYSLRFFTARGVYNYATVLRGYVKKGNFDYMFFQATGAAEKIQRRQAFRLSCGIDIEFLALDENEDTSVAYPGFLRDISSGGVRLLTKDKIDTSHLLQLKLPMIHPDMALYGTILSTREIAEGKYLWQYGVEFVGATEAETERIVKFVHNEQQKARARN